jgi:hypothetical protein
LTQIINELFFNFGDVEHRVRDGQYDLLLVEEGVKTIIIPQLLESTIKPGSSLSMRMWRPPALRPFRFPGPPPVGPGPRPRPAMLRPAPPFRQNLVRVLPARRRSYKIKDLEIESELKAMGFEIDFAAELERAEVGSGELLKTLTNATGDLGGLSYRICDSSDSDDDSESDDNSDSTSVDGDD